jgi:hypothetical protein
MGSIDVINVRDYGAVGDGSTDDTTAFVNAIAAAFPGGQANPFTNKILWMPAGNYVISTPIYLTNILGGTFLGAGNGSTQILFNGNGSGGNSTLVNYPNLAPVFILDGVQYSTFAHFSISGNHTVVQPYVTTTTTAATTAAAGHNTITVSDTTDIRVNMNVYNPTHPGSLVGVYVTNVNTGTKVITLSGDVASPGVSNGDTIHFVSHITGMHLHQTGPNGNTTGNSFIDMNFVTFGTGIFAGDSGPSPANCENCTLIDVNFQRCAYAGLRIFGQNTLNWEIHGGGASECGVVSTFVTNSLAGNGSAAYSITTGGVTVITNPSISGGTTGIDYHLQTGQPLSVVGGRSESVYVAKVIEGGMPITFKNWQWGCTASAGTLAFDCTFGGVVSLEGCSLGPIINAGTPILAALGNAGYISMKDCVGASHFDQMTITGASTAKAAMSGQFSTIATPTATNMFGSFTGTVTEYSPLNGVTVSSLPTAAAKYTGLKAYVTDANATTFNSTVAGSGANKVPVFCNGSNWVIG